MKCAECGAEPRLRYPGGDPENGPAAVRCKCPSAQDDPMWGGEPEWHEHPEGCDCAGCAYDEWLDQQMREECERETGGKHSFYYTGDGNAESGPSSIGEVVCRYCHCVREEVAS